MLKSKLEKMPSKRCWMVTVDFNPVADRLRVIGSDGLPIFAPMSMTAR